MIHESNFPARSRRLIRALFSGNEEEGQAQAGSPLMTERERVLDAIRELILANNLELSPRTLLAAYAMFSGRNPRLRRRIEGLMQRGDRITQGWLDEELRQEDPGRGQDGLAAIAARLESTVEQFGDTTSAAHGAMADYSRDLAGHARVLDEAMPDAGDRQEAMGRMQAASRAMLDQTSAYAERLRRAEDEARRLREQLVRAREEALRDALTDLPNRRGFEATYEREYRAAESALEPLCVAFCDIDRFKAINDSYGHDTGDRVIRAVADLLRRMTDETCHAARHGGEEFVMLFRGLSVEEAHDRLDEARRALAGRRFVQESTGEVIGKVTFSAGIADVFGFFDRSLALRAADEALYAAKMAGRDQISIALRG